MPGLRGKAGRELVAAIEAAGGTVEELAGRRHANRVKVTGPAGSVTVTLPRDAGFARRRGNTTSLLRNKTGLEVEW